MVSNNVIRMPRPRCRDDFCPGWLVDEGTGEIERCTVCARFETDDQAAAHAARYIQKAKGSAGRGRRVEIAERKKKTLQRYVRARGRFCPICGSTSTSVGIAAIDDEATAAFQDLTCDECGRSWQEEYKLASVILYPP